MLETNKTVFEKTPQHTFSLLQRARMGKTWNLFLCHRRNWKSRFWPENFRKLKKFYWLLCPVCPMTCGLWSLGLHIWVVWKEFVHMVLCDFQVIALAWLSEHCITVLLYFLALRSNRSFLVTGHHVACTVCPKLKITTQFRCWGHWWIPLWRLYDADLLLPASSSSSTAAAIGALTVMGLLRFFLSDAGEGTLGEVLHYWTGRVGDASGVLQAWVGLPLRLVQCAWCSSGKNWRTEWINEHSFNVS